MIKDIETAKQDFAKLRTEFVSLNTFMASADYDKLADGEQSLIDKQVDGMYNYLDALGKRIADKGIYGQRTPFEAVDLGLPSGRKWANMNFGADAPEQTGLYFSFDEANASDLGDGWKMPTKEDFRELYDNTTSEWTTLNGVYGRLFTSKLNGNSIFFPAAGYYSGTTLYGRGSYGYYWSASRYSGSLGYRLLFYSGYVYPQYFSSRRFGFSVRAVQ
jgi:uncharacterized protein (TIGR02145 family)